MDQGVIVKAAAPTSSQKRRPVSTAPTPCSQGWDVPWGKSCSVVEKTPVLGSA